MTKAYLLAALFVLCAASAYAQEPQCDGDKDGDGFEGCIMDTPFVFAPDCEPFNPDIHPDAVEVRNDGIDNNCDGVTDVPVAHGPQDQNWCPGQNLGDPDGDNYNSYATEYPGVYCGDHNPFNKRAYHGARERCDGIDNDGDGLTDEFVRKCTPPRSSTVPSTVECGGEPLADRDGDGSLSYPTSDPLVFCGDFDPLNPLAFPGAPERCDSTDNDGDGFTDSFIDPGTGGEKSYCGRLVGSPVGGCQQTEHQSPLGLLLLFVPIYALWRLRRSHRG